MALYSPVCPIRPVEIDIPFHGSAIIRPNSKKNRNKETLDADDKAGVTTERVPSPFVLRVLGHRNNYMSENSRKTRKCTLSAQLTVVLNTSLGPDAGVA